MFIYNYFLKYGNECVCGEEGIVQNKNQEHFFKSAEKIAVKWWRYFEAHTHQRYCDSIFKTSSVSM